MKMIYQLQKLTVIDRRNQTSVKIYRLIFKNALHHSYKLELLYSHKTIDYNFLTTIFVQKATF